MPAENTALRVLFSRQKDSIFMDKHITEKILSRLECWVASEKNKWQEFFFSMTILELGTRIAKRIYVSDL